MWIKIDKNISPGVYVYRRKSKPNDWQLIIIRNDGEINFKFGNYPTLHHYMPDDAEIAIPKEVLILKHENS